MNPVHPMMAAPDPEALRFKISEMEKNCDLIRKVQAAKRKVAGIELAVAPEGGIYHDLAQAKFEQLEAEADILDLQVNQISRSLEELRKLLDAVESAVIKPGLFS